jgi:thioredoxin-like negative regulator of GroEL
MTRREKIEAMLADDPADVFLRYSLAMELDKEGSHDLSLAKFAELTVGNPPYVPAFFMSAQQLARLNRTDEARSILRYGITAARQQNDQHAAAEMAEFLISLGDAADAASTSNTTGP